MSVDEDRLDGRPEDALVGTLFAGCYEIVSVLGRGGMSVVYKALYVPLNQLVAVKVMHTHVDDGAALQRLKREAQLISTLDHPNIVRVLRLQVSEEGYPYLVADLIEGRTIQKVVQEDGTFDEATFMHVFTQVMDALEHAHSRSIVHRDIKPSNLMITREEDGEMRVKVVDFGISKLLIDSAGGAQDVSRATSSFFGTPAYMSPEQCAGRSADFRSDIYSLACVMYETLTGVPAVTGETALDIMYHQVHDTPRSFSQLRPDLKLSPHIEQAIFTALRKNRNDRPQSIHEFRTMLSGHLPVERAIYHGRMRRLSKWAVIVVGMVVLMMAIVLGVPFTMMMSNDAISSGESTTHVMPNLPSTAEECYNEGMRAQGQHNNDLVIRCLQRADELVKFEKNSKLTPQHQFEVKMFLALAYRTRRDNAMGDRYYAEAEKLLKNTDTAGVGWHWTERSDFEAEKKHYRQAIVYARKGLAAYEQAYNTVGPYERQQTDLASAYKRLGEAYRNNGQFEESNNSWRQAVQVADPMTKWLGPKLEMRRLWADSLVSQHRFADAKKIMDEYMKIAQGATKANLKSDDELTQGYQTYGRVLEKAASPQAAGPYFAEAVKLSRTRSMSNFTQGWYAQLAESLGNQAVNLFNCDQIAEGERAAGEAKACWEKANKPDNQKVSVAAMGFARQEALKRAAARGN